MQIAIISLFPELIETYLSTSVLGKARQKNIFKLKTINLRDFGQGKRKQVDDRLFAGGRGMLMQVEAIWQAYLSSVAWHCNNLADCHLQTQIMATINKLQSNLLDADFQLLACQLANLLEQAEINLFYLSPKGMTFSQVTAKSWSQYKHLIFLCGHYEGIDSRCLKIMPWQEISLGNFVLTGGELAVLAMVDATLRMVDGVLPEQSAYSSESLYNGTLETEQFTQPANWHGLAVPDVLLQGNHRLQADYKQYSSLRETYLKRPDLFNNLELSQADLVNFIRSLQTEINDNSAFEVDECKVN